MADGNNVGVASKLLVCEGHADRLFFQRLIDVRSLERIHIWCANGNSKFDQALSAFQLKNPKIFTKLTDIIIVADNDDSPNKRFGSVVEQINRFFGHGFAPAVPRVKGVKQPRVSILMIPWDGEEGHLERMCVEAARGSNSNLGQNIDWFLDLSGADKWANSRRGKAWLRTYLAAACEKDPCLPLGEVFEQAKHHSLIPVNHSSFDRIADFLRSL